MSDTHEQHASIATYTVIYIWLVVLMFVTIGAWLVNLGTLNVLIALTIAIIKAILVVMFFMHAKYSGRLVWLFASAPFLWLAIMLALTLSDYVTREWVPRRLSDRPVATLFGTSD